MFALSIVPPLFLGAVLFVPPAAGTAVVPPAAVAPAAAAPAVSAMPAPRPRLHRAWRGMPGSRFRVSDPIFARRIAVLEERSVFARARLQAIRESGMRVWVVTPQALAAIAPRAPRLPVAWVTLLEGGRDVIAVIDLDWLRRQHGADGTFSEADFLRDLDLILGHELFVHIGSIGPGRDLRTVCADPDPVPGALGCSVVQENLFTFSLDTTRAFREEYRTLLLNTEMHGSTEGAAVRAVSGYYPELDERGWETTSYARFAQAQRLDVETYFQRVARMLWENGERERVETYYLRLKAAVLQGEAQAEAEARLFEAMISPRTPSDGDRFRIREIAAVRAGKHDQARAMLLRRDALLAGDGAMSVDTASAIVLREFADVSLAPESFEEAIEALHRRGHEAQVRGAFRRYLGALEAGTPEAAVRAALLAELLPVVRALDADAGDRH